MVQAGLPVWSTFNTNRNLRMDAFDKLGTICLILTCVLMVPFAILMRRNYLMMGLFLLCFAPILWIAGLQILEFLTKPFSEKGMKGIFTWIISVIMGVVIYGAFGVAMRFLLKLVGMF